MELTAEHLAARRTMDECTEKYLGEALPAFEQAYHRLITIIRQQPNGWYAIARAELGHGQLAGAVLMAIGFAVAQIERRRLSDAMDAAERQARAN